MRGTRVLVLFVLALLAVQGALGVVVSGKLYDEHFNQIRNVLVEITTFPKQTFVSKDGFYSFTITDGRYRLTAYYLQQNGTTVFTSKEVLASGEGNYIVDLILDQIYTGVPPEISIPFIIRVFNFLKSNFLLIPFFVFIFALGIGAIIFFRRRAKKTPPQQAPAVPTPQEDTAVPDDLLKVIELIKKGGGRITQRDLRRELPDISEAKISLMVSELEAGGLVSKIKKGRGNIVVLKQGGG